MKWGDLRLRVRAIVRKRRADAELEEEIEAHLEQQIRKYTQAGVPVAEAALLARRDFGSTENTKDRCRDERRVAWFSNCWQDLQYALRIFRRSPRLTALILSLLGVSIAGNVAIFSITDALLLKQLPVKHPEALFSTINATGSADDIGSTASYKLVQLMRERTRPFADLMAYQSPDEQPVSLRGAQPASLIHQTVSGNYFSLLGVEAAAGRLIAPEDDATPGTRPSAVISHRSWKRLFNESPGAIGSTIRLGDQTFDIVGVAPARFFGVEPGKVVDLWTPISMAPAENLQNDHMFWLRTMGRLHPNVTVAQAAAPMQAVINDFMLEDVHQHAPPGTPKSVIDRFLAGTKIKGLPAEAGYSLLRRQYRQPLQLIFVLVALVLLIACTNVANLILAKGAVRQRELAIRLSLGAGPGRLLQQLITEALLMGVASAVLGLLLARPAAQIIIAMLSPSKEHVEVVTGLDGRLLAFTMAVAFLTVILCGVLPAFRLVNREILAPLKGGVGISKGAGTRIKKTLVVLQVALSFALVMGAVLFSRTLLNLRSSSLGLDPANTLVARLTLSHPGDEKTMFPARWDDLLRRVQTFAGVKEVSLTSAPLFGGTAPLAGIRTNTAAVAPPDPVTAILFVSSDYFKTLGIKAQSGRSFERTDNQSNAPACAVVNQAFARKFFGGQDPVGRKLTKLSDTPLWTEIIGVVEDAKFATLRDPAPPMIYVPYRHMPAWINAQGHPGFEMSLQVRTIHGANTVFASELRHEIGTRFNLASVTPQQTLINDTLVRERLLAEVANVFGAFSLLLAASGLFGVMSYAAAQRTQEIGLRMALGATPRTILMRMLREFAVIVAAGIFVGILLAILGMRFATALLYGVSLADPATLLSAALMLSGASLIAALVPSYCAARIDPMLTLKAE